MSYSVLSFLFRVCLSGIVGACLWMVPIAQAQIQQASCTFKLVRSTSSDSAHPYCGGLGVNDWGTVVGEAWFDGAQGPPYSTACARYSGGGTSYYTPSGAARSKFYARNNKGVSVGYSADGAPTFAEHSFMLQGSTFTLISDPKAIPSATYALGINNHNSIVGWYLDQATGRKRGFKRYSNGSYNDINYPGKNSWGRLETIPQGINDSGVIVGTYADESNNSRGFIFYNGQWATLDYPSASLIYTEVYGISNAGVIVGLGQNHAFMYANGTFKNISVPNSDSTRVLGISADGLIVGFADFGGPSSGFTATCQ